MSRPVASALERMGMIELRQLDGISYAEFQRYLRGDAEWRAKLLELIAALEELRNESPATRSAPVLQASAPQIAKDRPLVAISQKPMLHAPLSVASVSETIFIPVADRGRVISAFPASVRLANIFEAAQIHVLGDLHGRTYELLGKLRNCGGKTLRELADLVRSIQNGTAGMLDGESVQPVCVGTNEVCVSGPLRELLLSELPLSVRLDGVLKTRGFQTLGDLDGVDLRELQKVRNCGRKSITELRELVRRAASGEFTVPEGNLGLAETLQTIDSGLAKLAVRDRRIFTTRYGADGALPITLEEIGNAFGLTRACSH